MSLFSYPDIEQIVSPLLNWFQKNSRALPWRGTKSPYLVWISEIMLQQTRIETVKSYYDRFIAELPDIESLANVSEEHLMKLWEGLGYYSRARNLQKQAKIIMTDYHGVFPNQLNDIAKLPGIGPYTCGAISSIVFGLPEPAVDGNVLRIMTRLAGCYTDITLPQLKKEVTDVLRAVYPKDSASAFTQGIMELGQVICLPNGKPQCSQCPLMFCCRAFQQNTTDEIPVKQHAKSRKIEEMTVFHLYYQDKIAICKRDSHGLLAGLWQFPNISGAASKEKLKQLLNQWKIEPDFVKMEDSAKHIFTHIEWHMQVEKIQCHNQSPLFTWVSLNDLFQKYALPTAFLKTITKKDI